MLSDMVNTTHSYNWSLMGSALQPQYGDQRSCVLIKGVNTEQQKHDNNNEYDNKQCMSNSCNEHHLLAQHVKTHEDKDICLYLLHSIDAIHTYNCQAQTLHRRVSVSSSSNQHWYTQVTNYQDDVDVARYFTNLSCFQSMSLCNNVSSNLR